jgi:hypothetical protein
VVVSVLGTMLMTMTLFCYFMLIHRHQIVVTVVLGRRRREVPHLKHFVCDVCCLAYFCAFRLLSLRQASSLVVVMPNLQSAIRPFYLIGGCLTINLENIVESMHGEVWKKFLIKVGFVAESVDEGSKKARNVE